MLVQDKVIEYIQKMPKEFSIEDLVERLVLIEKIENGLLRSANGIFFLQTKQKIGETPNRIDIIAVSHSSQNHSKLSLFG
jgi:ribosomal protein S3AE